MAKSTAGGSSGGSSKHGTSTKHATAESTKHKGLTAKQVAADKKWQEAGAAASAAKPRSAKQKAAAKKWAAAGAKAEHAKHTKARGLTLGASVMCCSAEALAASLRLTGVTVTDADVFTLYLSTVPGLDAGASILATLEAAQMYGIAGVRPVSFTPVTFPRAGDVLGVTLPRGAHTLTLDACGAVWTWGALGDLGDLDAGPVEEAWAVSWR